MKPKVLITNLVPESHLEPLLDCADIIYGPGGGATMPRDEVLALAPELTAIINQHELTIDDELLAAGPKLKVIANVAMGSNNMDMDALQRRGIWATNCPHNFSGATADHTLGLLLAVARRISEADRYVRSGNWPVDGFQPGVWDGLLLEDRTIGIIGFGKIGQNVAKRAEGFGMKVIFTDIAQTDDPRCRTLDALLAEADAISPHLPLTPQTKHLFNDATFAKMKDGAILLNLSRGPVVEEAALVRALESGKLFGAGLDVFDDEPQVHPGLNALQNVVMTPHVGGGTKETRKAARLLCARNIAAVLEGQAPETPINKI